MSRIILISCLIVAAMLLIFCNIADEPSEQPIADTQPAISATAKPGGAKITFSHNFDGRIEPGQAETVQLSFAERYSHGQLNIKLQADPGLDIVPATDQGPMPLSSETPHRIDLEVSAQTTGKYYLTIFASVVDEQGQSAHRVFAVAIQVGEQSNPKKAAEHKTAAGEPYILLPLEETVIQ